LKAESLNEQVFSFELIAQRESAICSLTTEYRRNAISKVPEIKYSEA